MATHMTFETNQQIAAYLIAHKDQFKADEMQFSPPVFSFVLANLPHNDILNDEFYQAAGRRNNVTVYQDTDDEGRGLNAWIVQL